MERAQHVDTMFYSSEACAHLWKVKCAPEIWLQQTSVGRAILLATQQENQGAREC